MRFGRVKSVRMRFCGDYIKILFSIIGVNISWTPIGWCLNLNFCSSIVPKVSSIYEELKTILSLCDAIEKEFLFAEICCEIEAWFN